MTPLRLHQCLASTDLQGSSVPFFGQNRRSEICLLDSDSTFSKGLGSTLHHFATLYQASLLHMQLIQCLIAAAIRFTTVAPCFKNARHHMSGFPLPVYKHRCLSVHVRLHPPQVLATSITRNTSEGLSSSGHIPPDSTSENDVYYGEDEDNMISYSKQEQIHQSASIISQFPQRNKHLRYRTRVFAAECVSHIPIAVGGEPAHFDLLLARSTVEKGTYLSNDWLVLKLQDLVSLSYQISTGQFEGMQPISVKLLCLIMDKFGVAADPEFPGHILLEQFQAQLVSAVRTAIILLLVHLFWRLDFNLRQGYKPFLDGIQSLLVSSKVQKYLDEVWALILQATTLDAAPMEFDKNESEDLLNQAFISGHNMVKLERTEFQ
ncbi:hypothetical protein ACP4OV_005729 [Aristida adscensionis]